MTSFTKNDNSGHHKIFKRKKILNRLYFPPTLHHSTHIVLLRNTGEPTHDLSHQERQLRPSQNIQTKKILNRLYFPPTSLIPPTFFCCAGPENQHMTSFTKNDNSGHHKILKRKKILKRLYFPPTLPHSTHIVLWRRTGEPTHDLFHQERQLRPSQNIQTKKKILNRLYFPPTLPHSTHIFLWRRPENQHMTSFTKNRRTNT
ncbi:hypothetical protein TNCV_842701 [Trichonephila clavipes]|nr:hypothetical protein TNCV_842701 [Trichonephila clavipes]